MFTTHQPYEPRIPLNRTGASNFLPLATMDPIIAILVVFLVLFLIFWGVKKFVSDSTVQTVIGIILGIVFLVYALNRLGVMGHLKL